MRKAFPFFVIALYTTALSFQGTDSISLGFFTGGAFVVYACVVFVPIAATGLKTARQCRRTGIGVGLALAISLSAVATQWPLRLAFAISEPALQRVARTVRDGGTFRGPQRVGVFLIQKAEVRHVHGDVVCLWTYFRPGDCTGLLEGDPDGMPRDQWFRMNLTPRWCFLAED